MTALPATAGSHHAHSEALAAPLGPDVSTAVPSGLPPALRDRALELARLRQGLWRASMRLFMARHGLHRAELAVRPHSLSPRWRPGEPSVDLLWATDCHGRPRTPGRGLEAVHLDCRLTGCELPESLCLIAPHSPEDAAGVWASRRSRLEQEELVLLAELLRGELADRPELEGLRLLSRSDRRLAPPADAAPGLRLRAADGQLITDRRLEARIASVAVALALTDTLAAWDWMEATRRGLRLSGA